VRSQPVVFDTSIYIPYFRREAYRSLIEAQTRRGRNRLSSVVIQELYTGTRSPTDKRLLDELNRAFTSRGYVVTPEHEEWVLAGQLLNQYCRRHGFLDPRSHVADVLILISALRVGAVLITENVRNFAMWLRLMGRRRLAGAVLGVRREDHLDS
jgi:predicted nucleic acid-binding protein